MCPLNACCCLIKVMIVILNIWNSHTYTVGAKSIRTRKLVIKKALFIENKH